MFNSVSCALIADIVPRNLSTDFPDEASKLQQLPRDVLPLC